ncbi:hypothetical protein GGR50DRAFT_451489 [Xylaria sp. CBS 124048]|nr:hypothetical protein GGR50DRAFT_451489 [Xylaria sp. CBS 124048]
MLDENLPTFYFRQLSDNSLSTILYFTQNGSEPTAEYSLQKLNPSLPQARNKYAIALGDASDQSIIFAEVLIEPEFQQPTLSAAEIRANNGTPPSPAPIIPESFTAQLYNPDQQVVIRAEKSIWMGKESFEFEIPQQTFRLPSASQIDRQRSDPATNSLAPRIMFKWKRESKFSKDMACYMTGLAAGGKKSKEPDVTVALYKHGRERAVTIYEPNLHRVELEDRKGLEIVILLSAEVIREIYLMPSRDVFNISGAPPSKRKNSAPLCPSPGSPNLDPYAIAQQEERDRIARDQVEQRRIQKMLEDEQRARAAREAQVERETEALRKQFGMEGQVYSPSPTLPARPSPNLGNSGNAYPSHPPLQLHTPTLPPRSGNTGPKPPGVGNSSWFAGPAAGPGLVPQFFGPGRRKGGGNDGKIQKKKSTFF